MFWRPSVKEISDWIEDNHLKFAEKENKDPRHSSEKFLQGMFLKIFMKFSLVVYT